MLFSKFCVYSSLLSPFFRVRYFPSWRDKNSGTVFGKTPVRLGTGKKSEVFYQSFILSLSIIHQANIKNVLYSLFVGSSRPKLESKNWSPLYVNVLSYLFELFKNEKALFVLKAYVETVLINKFLKSLILIL